jgi:predicted glycoside hydrolase/deacetylase ChbG (UPF0249 family)
MGRTRVIINADDFGWSLGINEGVLQAHRVGVVTSASIAVNMPAAEDAVRRLSSAPGLGVGVHLNAAQGPALSSAGEALSDTDRVMSRSAVGVVLACMARPRLLDAVEAEFDAQIRWALDHGLRPTHLDTHRHAHAYTPIFRRVAALAKRYGVRFVRRYGERLPGDDWPPAPRRQRWVSRVLNALGARNAARWPELHGTQGAWGVAHTGMIDARWLVLAAQRVAGGVTEIMTHPGLANDLRDGNTRLVESRQAELAALCDPAVKKAFCRFDLELVHYGNL